MSKVAPWPELERETLADCRIFTVERSIAASPLDGSKHDYYRLCTSDYVQIVPVTADDDVVMVRQYRHGSSSLTLEIPGGLIDPGEDPADAAMRECLEETGYEAPRVHAMSVQRPNPAMQNNRLFAFFARGVRRVAEIQNTEREQTEVELVPLAAVADQLRAGRIDHSLVAAALWQFLSDHA
jgi:8-oxo-dGTP pyrophosphatase MutT (NUDIX family)